MNPSASPPARCLRIRNWDRHQHYRDRRPPWIKLYEELLDKQDYAQLSHIAQLIFIKLLLVASRRDNRIPYNIAWLAEEISHTRSACTKAIRELVASGYVLDGVLAADASGDARPSRVPAPSREAETEAETEPKSVAVALDVDDADDRVERAKRALAPLRLTRSQISEAAAAFKAYPEGVERIAAEAMSGDVPAALFVSKLRAGDHEYDAHEPQTRVTGWRFVRGSHSGTYVEDPFGTDPLPPGYFAPGGTSTRSESNELERLSFADQGAG